MWRVMKSLQGGPELSEQQLPAKFYVTSGRLGVRPPRAYHELARMLAAPECFVYIFPQEELMLTPVFA